MITSTISTTITTTITTTISSTLFFILQKLFMSNIICLINFVVFVVMDLFGFFNLLIALDKNKLTS